MDPLHEYTDHWFHHTALRIGKPYWFAMSRDWILKADEARPGFAAYLREVAVTALGSSDQQLVRRAVVALAVVGSRDDVERLQAIVDAALPEVSADARTALFELARRAVRSRTPSR